MKITLLVVGKTTDIHIDSLIQEYLKRLTHYVPFALQVIPEIKNTKALTADQQKQAEGELILRAISPSTKMILLDEHGKEFRSVEYAEWLQKRMNSGIRRLVFVIGGPYGFSPEVYSRANEKISLSKMTFSHQIIRAIFTEQLYRAFSILNNLPYHHE